jgi:hypothetical protein
LSSVSKLDGKIESRENVEESNPADLEDTGVNEEEPMEMAEEIVPAKSLPYTTDSNPDNEVPAPETDSPVISELKAKIKALELELESYKMAEEMPEEELPKLDGAPIEEDMKKFSKVKAYGSKNKIANTQNTFLSKLYK